LAPPIRQRGVQRGRISRAGGLEDTGVNTFALRRKEKEKTLFLRRDGLPFLIQKNDEGE